MESGSVPLEIRRKSDTILCRGNGCHSSISLVARSFFPGRFFIVFIQFPVSLCDKVNTMIEYAYGIVDGLHDLIVGETGEKGLLKISIEPEVPPHHDEGIDTFMEGDAQFMLFLGVFHKVSPYFRVGPFAVIDPPKIFVKGCGIPDTPFFC